MRRLLASLALLLAACGGKQAPGSSAGAADSTLAATPLDELRALDTEIQLSLDTLGIAAPTPDDLTYARLAGDLDPLPASTYASQTCPAPPSDACSDVCTLADSICTNAHRICELASQLPADPYAADRCDSGRLSCSRATDRCCTC
jgi:hypothetical protein